MIRLRHKLFLYALRGLDQGMLLASLAAVVFFARGGGIARVRELLDGQREPHDVLGLLALSLGWFLCFNSLVRYETNRLRSLRSELLEVCAATAACSLLLAVVGSLLSLPRFTRDTVVVFWALSTALCVGGRALIRWALTAARLNGYNSRRVLLLGVHEEAVRVASRIEANRVLGYRVVGIVTADPGDMSEAAQAPPTVGTLDGLQSVLETHPVDEMILCLPSEGYVVAIGAAIRLAEELGIVVRLFPDASLSRLMARMHIERFEDAHVVTLFREGMLLQLFLKRLMDVVVSIALLVLLSPLFVAVAIGITLTSPGPVLFAQERVGMNRRRFRMYKFRSMYVDAERRLADVAHLNEMDGPVFKITNDPRVTPLGRWLRTASIDELPQLFNVLRGQMSLVGPRPPLLDEVDRYDWLYRKRLSIKPGITCSWQVSGRSDVSFKQWMELDRTYIDNWSLWLDLKILAWTVPAVLFRKGAR
jgi:exopolysaccharide biosynthesis polyprenyl glycosylphosphotransferase